MYDIYFDLNNMHQLVDDAGGYQGASYDEEQLIEFLSSQDNINTLMVDYGDMQISFDFLNGIEYDEPDLAVAKSENGLTCKACKDFYPYAEYPNQKDGSFKCWGCRNNF